jgi:starvation-inducible DNA-binding protein
VDRERLRLVYFWGAQAGSLEVSAACRDREIVSVAIAFAKRLPAGAAGNYLSAGPTRGQFMVALDETALSSSKGRKKDSLLRGKNYSFLCPMVSGPSIDENSRREDKKNMRRNNSTKTTELRQRRDAPLTTPTDLTRSATKDIAGAMNAILADVFALYLKTKNFHWHMSGPHFRDYHLLLDEHSDQLFAMTDPIAERIRKLGGLTIKSIGQIARIQRVLDNDADYVDPSDMIAELAEDNQTLTARLREAHNVCDEHRDVATASLIEVWIDETERRAWFLFEATRRVN